MEDYLIHYGVLGMKWGVRRYQNKDGTLTEAGKKRSAKHIASVDDSHKIKSISSEYYNNLDKEKVFEEAVEKTIEWLKNTDYELYELWRMEQEDSGTKYTEAEMERDFGNVYLEFKNEVISRGEAEYLKKKGVR